MASTPTAGAGEQGGDVEEGGRGLGRRRSPPISSLSAFSYIPPRREGPAELSYFHRVAQEGFPLMIPYLKDQRVTTKNFTDATENMQGAVVLTLMMSLIEVSCRTSTKAAHFKKQHWKLNVGSTAVCAISGSNYIIVH
ncbi:uncharacterized protein C5orf49 homolog isoform X2 [Meleagris gallopavo]|uniref:uncharacterized protein C5orf49 homolog isoform X2 n=1 Tax=Meleagris gallopavo TaxID=9103 RepID=UPI000549B8AB|nr:uncharacterized protein C5orf49 homolog isoform X2 [Meleagris gallopavo]